MINGSRDRSRNHFASRRKKTKTGPRTRVDGFWEPRAVPGGRSRMMQLQRRQRRRLGDAAGRRIFPPLFCGAPPCRLSIAAAEWFGRHKAVGGGGGGENGMCLIPSGLRTTIMCADGTNHDYSKYSSASLVRISQRSHLSSALYVFVFQRYVFFPP